MKPERLSRRQKSLRDDALALTSRGYRVFPVAAHRAPLVNGYFGNKPYPPSVIINQPWHKARHVGFALDEDEIALDVDVKQGKCGEKHMNALEVAHGPLPQTVQQSTLTGGRHLMFAVGPVAASAEWRSKAVLRDGGDADIDIVHGGHRFLVVYEPEVWLNADRKWPQIPNSWLPALLKPTRRKSGPNQAPTGLSRPLMGLDALLDEVRQVEEGDRNNTLNRWVFRATVDGQVGSDAEEQFRMAAQATGLTPSEVDNTISSSVCAGTQVREQVDRWFMEVLNHPDLQESRTRDTYLTIVAAVRDVALIAPQDASFGLSVRELAERAGVSRATANIYLKRLDANDLLQSLPWLTHSKARRYRLKRPRNCAQRLDSHPSLSSTGSNVSNNRGSKEDVNSDSGPTEMVRDLTAAGNAEQVTMELLKHVAFMRHEGEYLPRSCARVLAALEAGHTTRKDLQNFTGLHRNTVRSHLTTLVKACIVGSDEDGSFHLLGDSAWDAVDIWAKDRIIEDTHKSQRARHDAERQAYRQHLEATQTSNSQPGDHWHRQPRGPLAGVTRFTGRTRTGSPVTDQGGENSPASSPARQEAPTPPR